MALTKKELQIVGNAISVFHGVGIIKGLDISGRTLSEDAEVLRIRIKNPNRATVGYCITVMAHITMLTISIFRLPLALSVVAITDIGQIGHAGVLATILSLVYIFCFIGYAMEFGFLVIFGVSSAGEELVLLFNRLWKHARKVQLSLTSEPDLQSRSKREGVFAYMQALLLLACFTTPPSLAVVEARYMYSVSGSQFCSFLAGLAYLIVGISLAFTFWFIQMYIFLF